MWAIFKDENEYNEKAIIGFISFAVMVVFGVVDLVTGLLGQDLVINDNVYNSFVWVQDIQSVKIDRNKIAYIVWYLG